MLRLLVFLAALLTPPATWAQPLGGTITDGIPLFVNSNAALKNLTGMGAGTTVYRAGFNTAGDAGQPIAYTFSTTACSRNNGAGDNGSEVAPVRGSGCWNGNLPTSPPVLIWGVVPDGMTDNTTTLQNALNYAAATNGTVWLTAGTTFSSTPISFTLLANGSVTLQGQGQGSTFLKTNSGTNIFNVTKNDFASSVHVRDITFLATGTSGGVAINLTQTGTNDKPAYTGASDFTNITCRGTDGFAVTYYFAACVQSNYVSNLFFTNDTFAGTSTAAGIGINLTGGSSNDTTGVVYNVVSCNFDMLNEGIYYGPYIQGVNVTTSNMTGVNYGVYVPASETQTAQLTLTGNQFGVGTNGYAVYDQTGVLGLDLTANFIYLFVPNITAVDLVNCIGCQLVGNVFIGASNTGTTGVNIQNTGVEGQWKGAVVNNNQFTYMTNGIVLGSNAQSFTVVNNQFYNVTSPVISSGPAGLSGLIIGSPFANELINIKTVSGATSGAGGNVELTLNATTGLVNNQLCLIAGVGGLGLVSGAIETTIRLIDSTHILLQGVEFSGSYTSGGTVTCR